MSNPQVALHVKDFGVITLELDQDKAPRTVANFMQYVKQGFYKGTIFHRVIEGFMAPGGGAGHQLVNLHTASRAIRVSSIAAE